MLDRYTLSRLLGLFSDSFWRWLENNKCGPKAEEKLYVPAFIRNELHSVCCSTDSDITKRPSAKSPQHRTSKLTKHSGLKRRSILLLITTIRVAITYPSKKKYHHDLLLFLTLSSMKSPVLFLQIHPSRKILSSVFQQSSSSTLKLT